MLIAIRRDGKFIIRSPRMIAARDGLSVSLIFDDSTRSLCLWGIARNDDNINNNEGNCRRRER